MLDGFVSNEVQNAASQLSFSTNSFVISLQEVLKSEKEIIEFNSGVKRNYSICELLSRSIKNYKNFWSFTYKNNNEYLRQIVEANIRLKAYSITNCCPHVSIHDSSNISGYRRWNRFSSWKDIEERNLKEDEKRFLASGYIEKDDLQKFQKLLSLL